MMLMNRSLSVGMGLICIIACNSNPKSRTEDPQKPIGLQSLKPGTYVFAKGGLRLRAQPNETAKIVALIPDLSQIRVPGEEKHSSEFDAMHKESPWVPATFQDKKGYVSREYLRTILSAVMNARGTIEVLEVVTFPSQRGEYMLEAEFYLRNSQKLAKLPGKFRETSQPFWLDDRYVIFRTHFGDGGSGSDDIYRMDTESMRIDFLHGAYYSLIESGHCNVIPSCICGGRFYRYLKNTYFLEAGEKHTALYILPEYPHEENTQCKHGIPRSIMKKIATINEIELTYNPEYYHSLQFMSGKKQYTLQADGITIK